MIFARSTGSSRPSTRGVWRSSTTTRRQQDMRPEPSSTGIARFSKHRRQKRPGVAQRAPAPLSPRPKTRRGTRPRRAPRALNAGPPPSVHPRLQSGPTPKRLRGSVETTLGWRRRSWRCGRNWKPVSHSRRRPPTSEMLSIRWPFLPPRPQHQVQAPSRVLHNFKWRPYAPAQEGNPRRSPRRWNAGARRGRYLGVRRPPTRVQHHVGRLYRSQCPRGTRRPADRRAQSAGV
mmetsp:Transcript_54697/g.152600  ORF Transcript_54697/g.152600 Transcript_54697/m.152600 type:complete len:232 (-) Transcript_54697:101-796(-)